MNRYNWGGSKGSPSPSPSSSKKTPTKRISTPAGQRLSVIMESSNQPPPASRDSSGQSGHRLTNLSIARRLHLGPPPGEHEEKKPPSYFEGNIFEDETRPPSRFLPDTWRQDLQRRGGWKRFALLVVVILAVVIALAVGLGVGLTRHHSSDTSSTPAPSSASTVVAGVPVPGSTSTSTPSTPQGGAFPLGSYAITLLLSSANTSCTQNPATWNCYPGVVYSGSSADSSQALFNWIITDSGSSQLQISSSDNPFVPQFSNLPLTLEDAGKETERYTFQMASVKTVSPSVALTDDNAATKCFFNQTTLQGSLYTRKTKSYPSSGSPAQTSSSPESTWMPWPGAASFEEVAGGGDDVPNCYRTEDNSISGDKLPGLAPQPQGKLCNCLYMNYT